MSGLGRRGLVPVLLALIPGLAIACGSVNALVSRGFLLEDSFYYFTLARRLLAGDGFTLDGIHATNGFHPLHLFLLVPGAAVLGQEAFLRYAVILGAVTHAATCAMLARFALPLYGPRGALAASLLWAVALASRLQHLNGMETGLFLFLLLATSHAYLGARDGSSPRGAGFLPVGLLLGATYLARIDALLLAAAIALDLCWRRRREALGPLLRVLAGFSMAVLPWLAISAWTSGGVFPDSGPASRFLAREMGAGYLRDQLGAAPARPEEEWSGQGSRAARENLVAFGVFPVYWSPPFSFLLGRSHFSIFSPFRFKPFVPFLFSRPQVAVLLSFLLAAWILIEARRRGALFLAAAALGLVAAYAVYPAPPWFAIRYAAPALLAATLFLAAPVAEALGRTRRGGAILAAIGAAYVVANAVQHVAVWPNPQEPEGYHAEALWTRAHVPPGARIGCFQAGVMSYFSERTVVNLDGVVSRAALHALEERRLGSYLADSGVEYVSDWKVLLDRLFWPRSGLVPGEDATLIKRGFYDLWRVENRR